MSELTECGICNITMIGSDHRPFGLSSCGHSFCYKCVNHLSITTKLCPTCREPFLAKDIKPNFALETLIEEIEKSLKSTYDTDSTSTETQLFSSATNGSASSATNGGTSYSTNGSSSSATNGGASSATNGGVNCSTTCNESCNASSCASSCVAASATSCATASASCATASDLSCENSINSDYILLEPINELKISHELDIPIGLLCHVNRKKMRIVLADNSGSTNISDGKIVIKKSNGTYYIEECTRWVETKVAIMDLAKNCQVLGIPLVIIILNPLYGKLENGIWLINLPDNIQYPMNIKYSESNSNLDTLKKMLDAHSPNGSTPLTSKMNMIIEWTEIISKQLNTLKIILIIITDGLPSEDFYTGQEADKIKFRDVLIKYMKLPAVSRLVLRLVTNDEEVISWYDLLDKHPEIPMDGLDDLVGEAVQIYDKGNKWLNYSLQIQQVRTLGTENLILDWLDEIKLDKRNIITFVISLVQLNHTDIPDITTDLESFFLWVEERIHQMPLVWNPLTETMSYPLNISELRYALKQKSISSYNAMSEPSAPPLDNWTFINEYFSSIRMNFPSCKRRR